MVSVFVLDDQAASRGAIATALHGEGLRISGTAPASEQGIHAAAATQADVVIVTIDARGSETIERVHDAAPKIRILALSGHDPSFVDAHPVRRRADMVLAAGSEPHQVADAIRRIAEQTSSRRRKPGRIRGPARLTRREDEILSMLAQGLNAQMIADRLYISRRTVEFHLAHAYRKLGVRGRINAIVRYSKLIAG